MMRLGRARNPKYYAAAVYGLHYMTVRCLSRAVIGANSTAALNVYQQAGPGVNYAATLATHDVAWRNLCAVHVYGHAMPKTDMDRTEDILKLVESYQGHNKTRRKYLETLGDTGFSNTVVQQREQQTGSTHS